MYKVVLVLLAAVGGSLSQLVINGTCPFTFGSMSAYNYYNITGTWYQIQRITNSLESGDCSTTAFEGTIATTMVNREIVNSRAVFNNGTIALRVNEPHRFTVTFSDGVGRDYYLIGTNFNSFALIGRCDLNTLSNNVTQTSVYAWKLSRYDSLTTADNTLINQLVAAMPSLAGASWRSTSHDNTACQFTNGAGGLASSLVMIVTTLLFAAKEIEL